MADFVQKFDAVPQFWQFLGGLRFDDLIIELIQNELDAKRIAYFQLSFVLIV